MLYACSSSGGSETYLVPDWRNVVNFVSGFIFIYALLVVHDQHMETQKKKAFIESFRTSK